MSFRTSRSLIELGAKLSLTFALLCTPAFAQEKEKLEGMIKSRSGPTIILATTADAYINVLLKDTTTVAQNQGLTKVRKKEMTMAALIPGLQISVSGRYDADKMFVAESITFNGDDLERAFAIQAGLSETDARSKQNQEQGTKHAAELEKQNEALAKQQSQLKEHEGKIAANRALIDANTARFGQLDDYYIYDEVTVFFANGKSGLEAKYKPQLSKLAEKAITVEGYMVQVKGYASASGSAALNQKLSADRAAAVADILVQDGHVPLTRMLAPGAMGESQAKEGASAADEANDRKVIVRVLQNKGIAGIK